MMMMMTTTTTTSTPMPLVSIESPKKRKGEERTRAGGQRTLILVADAQPQETARPLHRL